LGIAGTLHPAEFRRSLKQWKETKINHATKKTMRSLTSRGYRWMLFLALLLPTTLLAQTITNITGTIRNKETGEPIPFASVYFKGAKGVVADSAGAFEISTTKNYTELFVSYIGYKTTRLPIEYGKVQEVNFALEVDSKTSLGNVVVKSKKKIRYTNKNNPAVELIRRVIEHKEQNRPQAYDYLSYSKYEKIGLALSRNTEKLQQSKLLRRYAFLLENTDTALLAGKALTPIYLEEKLSQNFYRKDPRKTKSRVEGERRANFGDFIDSSGVSSYLKRLYEEVDVYNENISLFTNSFLSPIAQLAPSFYMYFIRDTVTDADGKKLVQLYFTPRNTNDFLFRGTLYVTLDTNYAVQKLDMTVSPNINMNWVRQMRIAQRFEKNEKDGHYLLSRSYVGAEAALSKNRSGGVWGERTISFKDYQINRPLPDSVYAGETTVASKAVQQYTDSFWLSRRHEPLRQSEVLVYRNIDSLSRMPSFRRLLDIGTLVIAGYKSFGPFEIGPASTFYSFNPVEGFRLRFGGRTTPELSKRLYFETYGAYGFGDQRWKGFFSFTYSLNNKSVYSFPLHYVRASVQRETKIPGQELQFVQEDNLLLSFKRGVNDRWLYNDIVRLDYVRELSNRFSYSIGFKNWRQEAAGGLRYERKVETDIVPVPDLTTSELSVQLRWAPNEQFYQGKIYRIPIINRYPIFTFRYTRGLKGVWDGGFNYDKFQLMVEKRVFLSQFGFSDVALEGTYTNGTLPYPLLSIHRANQTYALQLNSYNLMNFLEFVSDKYVSLHVDHHFNGFIFNRVPLLEKLNLREIVSAKVIFGGVGANNNPANNKELLQFPQNDAGQITTFSLNGKPYIEGSVGIGNIFKLLRLDLVKRFTHLNNPNVAEWGVRGRIRFDF
jgi:hypothetical protein